VPSRRDPDVLAVGRGGAVAYGEAPPPRALADRVACVWWIAPATEGAGDPAGAGRGVRPSHALPAVDGARPATPSGGDAPGGVPVEVGPPAILPDGCVDLVLHGGVLTVAGPDTRARSAGDGSGTAVGVRLRPGAATTFGVSASELRDRHPTAEELWGPGGRLLAAQVAGAASDRERLVLMLREVGRRAASAPPTDPVVDGAVALLAGGGTTVAAVAGELGVGERLLRRRVVEHVGYGPKTLDRVLRLQRFLALAIATDEGLAALAAVAGYADQAHLGREARALAATTPARLVASRRPAVSETSKTTPPAGGRMAA
jgi:AraC-like DNA-binding protein